MSRFLIPEGNRSGVSVTAAANEGLRTATLTERRYKADFAQRRNKTKDLAKKNCIFFQMAQTRSHAESFSKVSVKNLVAQPITHRATIHNPAFILAGRP